MLANSQERPPLLAAIWRCLMQDEKPVLLAMAIVDGDDPSACSHFLRAALRELTVAGTYAFDGKEARDLYALLPELVTVHRGTVQAELDDGPRGVSWTLDADKARWFATKHGRFRNTQSQPVLVTGTVEKANIGGVLMSRHESEVLVDPADVGVELVEPLRQESGEAWWP